MERAIKVRSFFTIFKDIIEEFFEIAIDNPVLYCLRFIERMKRKRADEKWLNPLQSTV